MQFLIDNFEYIALLLLLGMVVISVVILIYVFHISNFFSNRKFRIIGGYEYEPLTNTKEFVIQVFNNNINDSRIVGFGFMYKEQTIDYYKTYYQLKNLDLSNKLIVLSRDSFKLSIQADVLETIIADYNREKKFVSRIMVYVIDAQGIMTKSNARKIRKVVAYDLKNKRDEKQEKDRNIKKTERNEIRKERRNNRKLKRMQFLEKMGKWWLVLKTKFSRKPKTNN